MSIERLSFPEGQKMRSSKSLKEAIAEIVLDNYERLASLSPGEYDLTPPEPFTSECRYQLIVYPDGRGRVITFQKDRIETLSGAVRNGYVDYNPDARQQEIPEDSEIFTIATDDTVDAYPKVFEIVLYLPGNSPRR